MTQPTDTDPELIARIKASGSADALNELVGRHIGRIRRIIQGMGVDANTVDDLTQETFLRALRNLAKFRGESRFASWLTRIALNVAYSHLGHRDSSLRLLDTIDEHATFDSIIPHLRTSDSSLSAVSQTGTVGLEIERAEINQLVGQAIMQLTPPLRAAIVLTVFDGLTATEAAEIEQCPLGTMYWRIHEARNQLRVALSGLMQ